VVFGREGASPRVVDAAAVVVAAGAVDGGRAARRTGGGAAAARRVGGVARGATARGGAMLSAPAVAPIVAWLGGAAGSLRGAGAATGAGLVADGATTGGAGSGAAATVTSGGSASTVKRRSCRLPQPMPTVMVTNGSSIAVVDVMRTMRSSATGPGSTWMRSEDGGTRCSPCNTSALTQVDVSDSSPATCTATAKFSVAPSVTWVGARTMPSAWAAPQIAPVRPAARMMLRALMQEEPSRLTGENASSFVPRGTLA
jgi:hypothetical protein